MATIEERAYKAFCGQTSCRPDSKIHLSCINCLHDSRKDAYIKGAISQREIDIERAVDWFCKNAYFEPKGFLVEEFRKAMMEE